MDKIAILVSADMMPGASGLRSDFFELEEQMGKLTPAFAALGFQTELVLWKTAAARAGEFAAMLPLIVWDYFETGNPQLFAGQMQKAAEKTCVLNPPEILNYNSDKSYLDDLEARGAPVIPSRVIDNVTQDSIKAAYTHFDCDQIVAKPQIGAGAWRQALLTKGEPFPEPDQLPPGRAILQPFLPSVLSEGEYSFLYFDGVFSHAVNKRPKAGDYRIQSTYGGREHPYDPKPNELKTAQTVLSYLPQMPLYARVDLLRGLDAQLKLIELEMIEPYLYFPFANGEAGDNEGAKKLAAGVARRLSL